MTAIHHTMDNSQWDFWRAALKGKSLPDFDPKLVPIGYYRSVDRKTGIWKPVAIWIGQDGLKRVRNAQAPEFPLRTAEEEEDYSFTTFAHISKHAISHGDYKHWMANSAWPAERNPDPPPAREATTGDNAASSDQIGESIKELREEAEAWLAKIGGEITTQEQSDKAADYASRFAELEKEADETRTALRKPHMESAEAVQKVWKPIQDAGAAAKSWAKGLSLKFQQAERVRQLREAAERAAAGEAVKVGNLTPRSGTRGRAQTLRTRKAYKVTDCEALWQHYVADPRLRMMNGTLQALKELVTIDTEAGKEVPGAVFVTVESIA